VIRVCDNGMGMDPAHIERMLEMFAQEEPVADRSHGLALVKSIVEMHGGGIEAFSAGPGKGSEFKVTLPAVRGRADGADAQSAVAVTAPSPPPARENHRGLILMPDLSGHEVARQIRQTEWGKRMVLVAATGWGQESDEREAIEAGFDAHMTKPVDLRKLSAVVDALLLRRRG